MAEMNSDAAKSAQMEVTAELQEGGKEKMNSDAAKSVQREITAGLQEGGKGKARNIVVAVNDSAESLFALSWVLDNLLSYSRDKISEEPSGRSQQDHVYIVYVEPPPPVSSNLRGLYISSDILDSVRTNQKRYTDEILERAKKICEERLVAVDTVVVVGDARDGLCQAAEQLHTDFLVVGSHGYGKVKRAFLGSVSDYCAHYAKCPVLIVKNPNK